MHAARSATLPEMILRVAVLTLPVLLLFTATVLPLALHLPALAAVFGLLNLAMLAWRIRVEDGALRG